METILLSTPMEGVTEITLNRADKRNAMNAQMIQELIYAFQTISTDKKTHIVLLTGKGEHFCAGADITLMQKMSECSQSENVQDAMHLATLLKNMYHFPKPIISITQGAVMGGGLGIVACCDIVISSNQASFCFSEAKIGLTPSVISPYVIPTIGERAARYYYLTAEKFSADKAVDLHLVQQAVPPELLRDSGLTLIKTLLKNSPHALIEAKRIIRRVAHEKYSDELIQFTAEHLAIMRTSPDAQEGLQAFMEKRVPVWK